ncbi:MAG: hypothetical protein IT340_15185 [Chloroflexi bacterium]|nr:hypothetical protein [Chloroflexota bacterium]
MMLLDTSGVLCYLNRRADGHSHARALFSQAPALTFLQEQRDKAYSLCDAVSFLVMQQYQLSQALSTDHHVAQAGYRPLFEDYA